MPQLLASLPVEILEEQEEDGFTSALIRCDAATAATIAKRYHAEGVWQMISDIRFITVLGKTTLQVKRCEPQVNADGSFCGLLESPWEPVPTVHFKSLDLYREEESRDRRECADALAYRDLAASSGIGDCK